MVTHITWSRQKDTACDKPHPWRYRRLPLLSAAALIILITTGMSLTLLPIPAFANTASPIHRLSLPSGLGLVGTLSGISTISCPTKVDCLAAGDGTRGAVILRSSNGGASWSQATLPTGLVGHATGDLASIACPTTNQCLAVGYDSAKPRLLILRSSNSGASWSRVTPPKGLGLISHHVVLYKLACTQGECLAAGVGAGPAVLLSSSNGGASWSRVTLPPGLGLINHPSGAIAALSCPSQAKCLAGLGLDTKGAMIVSIAMRGLAHSSSGLALSVIVIVVVFVLVIGGVVLGRRRNQHIPVAPDSTK